LKKLKLKKRRKEEKREIQNERRRIDPSVFVCAKVGDGGFESTRILYPPKKQNKTFSKNG
jgi:hypothetical protein